jgi:type II secretory pathway pseudopilin PulG
MHSSLNNKNDSGYILIELAIVMIIMALLLAASIPLYNSFEQRNAKAESIKRMDVIAKALSTFAQSNFRLPCAADAGADNSDEDNQIGHEEGSNPCTSFHGIVPYRTLGIPEQYAKDGYGNFFTYVVSEDFTLDNRLLAPNYNTGNSVHRRLAHLVAGNATTGNYALLPRAKFCAPTVNSGNDITVNIASYDSVNDVFTSESMATQQRNTYLYPTTGEIINVPNATSTPIPSAGTPDPNLQNITVNDATGNNIDIASREIYVTAAAVAIISHGENGIGAYQADGNQNGCTNPPVTPEEITCNDNNIVERTSDWDFSGGGEYDDIIQFYTQDQIYALAGRNSCEHL